MSLEELHAHGQRRGTTCDCLKNLNLDEMMVRVVVGFADKNEVLG